VAECRRPASGQHLVDAIRNRWMRQTRCRRHRINAGRCADAPTARSRASFARRRRRRRAAGSVLATAELRRVSPIVRHRTRGAEHQPCHHRASGAGARPRGAGMVAHSRHEGSSRGGWGPGTPPSPDGLRPAGDRRWDSSVGVSRRSSRSLSRVGPCGEPEQ
jgi:hypothetical protein